MKYLILFSIVILSISPVIFATETQDNTDKKLANGDIIRKMEEIKDEKTGEILPLKKGVATGVINATIDRVWAVIGDYENFKNFMPRMIDGQVRGTSGNITYFFGKLNMPWPVKNISYIIELTHNKKDYEISWKMLPGTGVNIKQNYGSWKLEPYKNNQTKLTYTLLTEPEQNIPAWAYNMGTNVTLPQIFDAIRKQIKDKKYDLSEKAAEANKSKTEPEKKSKL